MRELVLRMERSERAMLRELEESRARSDARHAELMRDIATFREKSDREHREMIEDLRAGRGALLAILDRLNPGGSAA